MPRQNFDPDKIDWKPFFIQPQVGGAYFRGKPYMHGTGIGALFSSVYRVLLPIVKSIGKEIGHEGIAAGSRILGDISKGEDPKESFKSHAKEGMRNLLGKASEKMRQSGSGHKKGHGKQKGRGKVVHTYRTSIPKKRMRTASAHSNQPEGRSIAHSSPPNKKRKGRKKKRFQQFDSLGPY